MSPPPDGYQRTEDLVAAIKRVGDFEVSVSAYPEKHPQSPTLLHDIEALKRKVDAGADRAITQFFFDNSVYFRFLDVAAAAGIDIPIVPGIVPVQNFKQTANFAKRAGASMPAWLAERFEGLEDDLDDAPTRRGGGLRRTGDRPDRPRRHATAFLHDESRRPRVRDLPSDRPARASRADRGAGPDRAPGVVRRERRNKSLPLGKLLSAKSRKMLQPIN